MTLLSNKADPEALDVNGQTPLHMAAAASAIGLTNVLLRLRHPELPPGLTALDRHGRSPLRLAVVRGRTGARPPPTAARRLPANLLAC